MDVRTFVARLLVRYAVRNPGVRCNQPVRRFHQSTPFQKKRNVSDEKVLRRPRPRPTSIMAEVTERDKPIVDFRDPAFAESVSKLLQYFPKKDIEILAKESPEVFVEAWEEVLAKLNYALFKMKINQGEIMQSSLLSYPLDRIMKRHTLLVKCGLYRDFNPEKQSVSPNPLINGIIRSPEGTFVKIAGITHEEFHIFSEMFDMEEKDKLMEDLRYIDGRSGNATDLDEREADGEDETYRTEKDKELSVF